ncbi:MAG: hypothetical protein R3C62_02720 [Chloroflexota bacterium]
MSEAVLTYNVARFSCLKGASSVLVTPTGSQLEWAGLNVTDMERLRLLFIKGVATPSEQEREKLKGRGWPTPSAAKTRPVAPTTAAAAAGWGRRRGQKTLR